MAKDEKPKLRPSTDDKPKLRPSTDDKPKLRPSTDDKPKLRPSTPPPQPERHEDQSKILDRSREIISVTDTLKPIRPRRSQEGGGDSDDGSS